MPTFTPSTRPPVAATYLPLTLISLDAWAMISVQGPDSAKYLQGQLTLDITQLGENRHQLTAQCDAKGKVISTLRIFPWQQGFGCLLRQSLVDNVLAELKKYAVFSKVTIEPVETTTLLGLAGAGARRELTKLFTQLPDATAPVIVASTAVLLWFAEPEERFLLAVSAQQRHLVMEALSATATFSCSEQWQALNIEVGQPIIDNALSRQFIPQALNLQLLNAISFTKGCYTGQEMVARAKYRGANKRAMYWLVGSAGRPPIIGEPLELKIADKWRLTGTVISAVQLENTQVWIQAVLNNDLAPESQLRLPGDAQGCLLANPLPYAMD